MKIIVSGSHLKQFPEMEEYAKEKVSKLERFVHNAEKFQIRLISETSHKNSKHNSTCEMLADIPGKNIEVVEHDDSMDKAIDKAVERMKVALIRHKEKSLSRRDSGS